MKILKNTLWVGVDNEGIATVHGVGLIDGRMFLMQVPFEPGKWDEAEKLCCTLKGDTDDISARRTIGTGVEAVTAAAEIDTIAAGEAG